MAVILLVGGALPVVLSRLSSIKMQSPKFVGTPQSLTPFPPPCVSKAPYNLTISMPQLRYRQLTSGKASLNLTILGRQA